MSTVHPQTEPGGQTAAAHRPTPPWLFFFLDLPFGAAVGYLQIAVPYWLALRGVPLTDIATLAATGFIPHAYKVLWVPLMDVLATRRTWFAVMGAAIALLLGAASLVEDPKASLPLLTVFMMLAQAAAATLSSALDSLMATTTAPVEKARAGGWKMAGNVGGTALLGTLPLWLGKHMTANQSGLLLGSIVLACTALIWLVDEPAPRRNTTTNVITRIADSLSALGNDILTMVKSRQGWTGLLICAAPVGCGALTNLFSGMAPSYAASSERVEMVNGLAGGVLAALGSIVGGYVADRMNRRLAYAVSGILTACIAIGMALAPTTEFTYTWGVLAYCFMNGVSFAAFAGMVLEMVKDGAGVTTKYALFVAVSNQAISYVTWLDGQGSTVLAGIGFAGVRGSILADALITFAGVAVLSVIFTLLRNSEQRIPAEVPVV